MTYIKNAFSYSKYGLIGAPASVNFVDNIDDFKFMLSTTKKLRLPISVFLKKTGIGNKFQIRYFIDKGEEPICIHGTIVAAQFLIDNNLTNSNTIEFEPMFLNDKYGNASKQDSIFAEISREAISVFINVIKPKAIDIHKKNEIISSICDVNKEYFEIKDILEGELDYTVEIEKSSIAKNNSMSSLDVIKSIVPNFELIEKITTSRGKLCRGIDVLIKNDKNIDIDCDYITRIFLPLGALEEFKEDPACGSGSSYVMKYLITKYPEYKNRELNFYQASKSGAYIKAVSHGENVIKISGFVK